MTEEIKTNEELGEWIKEEQKELEKQKESSFDGEILPSLILEEGVIAKITINFDKPFEKWKDSERGITKKIIPITHEGVKKNWWLNVKNPIYADIITAGSSGQREFEVLQSGKENKTRYTLVKRK